MTCYACIDIGGTAVKYGVLSENRDFLFTSSMPTDAEKGPDIWMMNIVDVIEKMKEKYSISGICVSSTAMIDAENGTVFFSLPQVPGYTGFDIKGFLEKHCNLPCEVENDVNCVVLAESNYGAGVGYDTVLGVTIGTGIGGGFTTNGKILHGATNSACEIGYIQVGNSDLEHEGSTSSLCRKVERMKGDVPESWDGRKIFAAAEKGDKICIQAIDEMACAIARGLSSLSYILNPHVIVLGGGIMNEDSLLERIREYYVNTVNPLIAERTPVVRAEFGNNAGMIGALCHFLKKHSNT